MIFGLVGTVVSVDFCNQYWLDWTADGVPVSAMEFRRPWNCLFGNNFIFHSHCGPRRNCDFLRPGHLVVVIVEKKDTFLLFAAKDQATGMTRS